MYSLRAWLLDVKSAVVIHLSSLFYIDCSEEDRNMRHALSPWRQESLGRMFSQNIVLQQTDHPSRNFKTFLKAPRVRSYYALWKTIWSPAITLQWQPFVWRRRRNFLRYWIWRILSVHSLLTNSKLYFHQTYLVYNLHKNVTTGLLVSVSQNHLSDPQY